MALPGWKNEKMKRAFMLSPCGEIISAVIPKTDMPTAFLVGDSLKLVRDLSLEPHGTLKAGVWVRVLDHDTDTGVVDLCFDTPVPGLHQWGQTLTLIPFDTDEALMALKYSLELNPNSVIEVV